MYVKITEEHLRRCAKCLQPCLKIPDSIIGELDEDEEAGLCKECHEDLVSAIPNEVPHQMLKETGSERGGQQLTIPGFLDERPN